MTVFRASAIAIVLLATLTGCRSEEPWPKIPASPRARDFSFQSASLGRSMKYRVLLPAGYEQGTLRYPVLYLLHGFGGDQTDWTEFSHIAASTDSLPVLVVMPDAGESWYVNSATKPQNRYEDYIVRDLVSEIDAKFLTVSARQARAIAGASMGGYGAVLFGLKYPDRFAFVASFGGALEANRRATADINDVFGDGGSATRQANDIFSLAKKQPAQNLPYVWLMCGDIDGNFVANRELAAILNERKVAYSYLELPGGHDGRVWDPQLPAMLSELSRHAELPAKPAITPSRVQKSLSRSASAGAQSQSDH